MSGGGGGSGRRETDAARKIYDDQADISRFQWDEYKQTGSPILRQLGEEVSGPQNPAVANRAASRASGDVSQAYDKEEAQWRRTLGRYGQNPGSGRYAAGLRQTSLDRAASTAGAQTDARRNVKLDRDRLRFGVLAAAQGQAGSAVQGLSNAGRGYSGLAGQARRSQSSRDAGIGQLIGTGLTAAAIFSDRRLKDNIVQVGRLFNGLPVYLFNYVFMSPEVRIMGLLADEVEEIHPDAVSVLDGFQVVDYQQATLDVNKARLH